MKKITLILAAVLCAASLSFAQFNLGGRAALNFGTVWGDDAKDIPWGLGFAAGLSAKISINNMLAVVPDVDVDLRRAADDNATWSVWALEIPVMFRVNATPQFFIEAGPMISILLSGKMSYDNSIDEEDYEVEENYSYSNYSYNYISSGDYDYSYIGADNSSSNGDYGKFMSTFEFGISAGLGFAVLPNLDINARFNLGLTSEIDDIDMFFTKEKVDCKNLQFQVGATFWFM